MKATELLQGLQVQHGAADPETLAYDDRIREIYASNMARSAPELRQMLEDNLRKRETTEARYAASLPTRFQSRHDYVRLRQAKDRIDVTLRKDGQFQPCGNLVLGSVESEQLNALSTYCDDSGEYLIVFNRGLLLSLLIVSNLAVCAFSPNPEGFNQTLGQATDPIDRVERNVLAHLVPRYGQVLTGVTEHRVPGPELIAPLVWTDRAIPWTELKDVWFQKEIRWTKLEDAVMEFVFAHEYAHILLGHLSSSDHDLLTEDNGGWDLEYEADSIAFDLVTQAWIDEVNDPLIVLFVLQGVCLFFLYMSQIERYSAQVRGSAALVWRDSKSHPPTYIRLTRMIAKARARAGSMWRFIAPQLAPITECLELYYAGAVGPQQASAEAAYEWGIQRAAFGQLAQHLLVPAHLFIAMRCVQASLRVGRMLDEVTFLQCAHTADIELEHAGARPLRDFRAPLPAVVRTLVERVLADAGVVGMRPMDSFIERLAGIFLLDAQTRYPLSSTAS